MNLPPDALRIVACGCVGTGRRTLLGRLQQQPGAREGNRPEGLLNSPWGAPEFASHGGFASLLEGPDSRRGPGNGLVATVRFLSAEGREFVVASLRHDGPCTRSLMAWACRSNLAMVVADAREEVLPRTKREILLFSHLGIRRVVLVVSKMDLAGYSPDVFTGAEAELKAYANRIGLEDFTAIPVSALQDENISSRSARMPWYQGPTLMECLERTPREAPLGSRPFRMLVDPAPGRDAGAGEFSGTIASGTVRTGGLIRLLPSGRESHVQRISGPAGDLAAATAFQAVSLTLEVGAAAADVITDANEPLESAGQFEATLIWFADSPMLPGRDFGMRIGAVTVNATVAPLRYRIDIDTLEHVAAPHLAANEIGVVQLELDRPVAFEPFASSPDLGGFTLVDRISNETVGAGMIRFALRRAHNVHWQALSLDKSARAALKGQDPCVLWFTGLPSSGKSTIANLVEKKLHAMGRHTYLLDGDNVRHGLNKDLGFTGAARVENIRRVAEVAKLMADAGLIVLAAFISPFRSERRMARGLLPPGEFLEIFVDTPLHVAEARDPKGLYRKARKGDLKNFTGIDSPYERPEHAEVTIESATTSAEDAAERVVEAVLRRGR